MNASNRKNKKPALPSEEDIGTLLSGFNPQPPQRFYRLMEEAPWIRKQSQKPRSIFTSLAFRLSALAVLSILLIISLFIFIPSLRTSADRLFNFFSSYDDNSRSIQAVYTPTSATSPLPETLFPLTLEQASQEAGFTPKELSLLSEELHLEGAAFSTNREALILRYSGGDKTILLAQRKAEGVQEYASIGPAAPVQIVEVRHLQGEFVSGGWIIQIENTSPPGAMPQSIHLVWDDQSTMRTLRWQEGDFIYEIVTNSSEAFLLAEILAIAESMR
jgi:hypothetical protein